MYGKAFESMYEGSMVGAGFHVFAVWNYCIAKNRSGVIELNPKLLAFILGGSESKEGEIKDALDYLTRKDGGSRTKDEDGRRLVKEGEFQYRMVNWAAYDSLKSKEDQREYNRRKQAEHRERERLKKKGTQLPGSSLYEAALKRGATEKELDAIVSNNLPAVANQVQESVNTVDKLPDETEEEAGLVEDPDDPTNAVSNPSF